MTPVISLVFLLTLCQVDPASQGIAAFKSGDYAAARKSLEQAIRGLNATIVQHKAKIVQQPNRQKELAQKKAELEALEKQPPSLPSELKEELDRVEALTRSKQDFQQSLLVSITSNTSDTVCCRR